MDNLEKILNKIENNFHNKNKKETLELEIGGETYTVNLLSRTEKAELIFSRELSSKETLGDIYKWLKPTIYKSLQLKDAALKAKEQGFINSYYEVIDMLFSVEEIEEIIYFILDKNNLKNFIHEEVEFQKK